MCSRQCRGGDSSSNGATAQLRRVAGPGRRRARRRRSCGYTARKSCQGDVLDSRGCGGAERSENRAVERRQPPDGSGSGPAGVLPPSRSQRARGEERVVWGECGWCVCAGGDACGSGGGLIHEEMIISSSRGQRRGGVACCEQAKGGPRHPLLVNLCLHGRACAGRARTWERARKHAALRPPKSAPRSPPRLHHFSL